MAWKPKPFASFRGAFVAWGLRNGTWTPAQLVAKLKARGCGWLCLQASITNSVYAAEVRDICHRRGMRYGTWQQDVSLYPATREALRMMKPDFFVAAVEGPGTWRDWLRLFRAANPMMQLGLITNFSGCGAMPDGRYDRREAAPWQQAGAYLIPEAYVCENPQATPEVLDWTAKTHLGWSKTYPCIGIYNGWTPEMYSGMLERFPAHSIYLAEYLH